MISILILTVELGFLLTSITVSGTGKYNQEILSEIVFIDSHFRNYKIKTQ